MTMLMKKLCDLTNLCLFVFACFEKESFFVVSRNDFTENLRKKVKFIFLQIFYVKSMLEKFSCSLMPLLSIVL